MRKRYEISNADDSDEELEDTESVRSKNSIYSVPFYVGIGVLIFLISLYGFVYLIDNALPTPLTVADEVNIVVLKYPDLLHDLFVL